MTPSRRPPSTWTPCERFGPAETGHRRAAERAGQRLHGDRTLRAPRPARRGAPRLPDHWRPSELQRGRAGLRPAAGVGADARRHQPLRRQPAGPAPRHPGRQHGDRRPGRGRGAALEPLARPGRQRPGHRRSSSTRSWPGTTPPPANPGTPRPSPPGPEAAVKAAAWDAAVHGTGAVQPAAQRHHRRVQHRPGRPAGRVHRPVLRVPGGRLGGAEHRDRQPDRPRASTRRGRTWTAGSPGARTP